MIIEEFKNIKIAYMRRIGKYGKENKILMENFKSYLIKNYLLNDSSIILGIALDNPINTPDENQRYDVGIIIKDDRNINLDTRYIDDGKYAIFEIPHTTQDIDYFWNNLKSLTSNLQIDESKPILERYSTEKINLHLCEFCIPLK